jgi:hypothetical protein
LPAWIREQTNQQQDDHPQRVIAIVGSPTLNTPRIHADVFGTK